jgi:hypothetical protein
MANALFDKARERYLTGALNWGTDTIKAVLVDSGTYTVNLTSHEFLSDIGTGDRISTSGAFASKTTTGGAADAADVTFSSVTGASIEAIVIYKDTGTDSTSPLIAYIDTATGLPITPNGGDIIVTWDNGPNKIFKL